jgi:hypothetical protein
VKTLERISTLFMQKLYHYKVENFKSEIIFWHENNWLFMESLYHYKLNRFKSEIIFCHEDNWLFKILFRDDLDGETMQCEKKFIKIH